MLSQFLAVHVSRDGFNVKVCKRQSPNFSSSYLSLIQSDMSIYQYVQSFGHNSPTRSTVSNQPVRVNSDLYGQIAFEHKAAFFANSQLDMSLCIFRNVDIEHQQQSALL